MNRQRDITLPIKYFPRIQALQRNQEEQPLAVRRDRFEHDVDTPSAAQPFAVHRVLVMENAPLRLNGECLRLLVLLRRKRIVFEAQCERISCSHLGNLVLHLIQEDYPPHDDLAIAAEIAAAGGIRRFALHQHVSIERLDCRLRIPRYAMRPCFR